MGKTKQLKNIVNGILSSFISRNNDVGGYWGIGKIYSLMIKSKSLSVEIDLINKTILPFDEQFLFRISEYSNYLSIRMKAKNIDLSYLKSAKIILKGFPNEKNKFLGKISPNRVSCKISIINLKGITYILEKNVWCREHNPKTELKRG